MKLLKNWKYHVFTLIYYFCICFFLLSFEKFVITIKLNRNELLLYFFLEWIICSVLLYLISIPIMLVLDKTKKYSVFSLITIGSVLTTTVLLNVLYQIILWPILQIVAKSENIKYAFFEVFKMKMIDVQYVNYFFFLFITFNWLVFIYSYKIYANNQQDLKDKLAIEKNLKEANLNTLKGQINPHFIFNSLNNIRGLVQEDPLKTKEMITRLSELLRSSLLSGKRDLVNLEEELEVVENFLAISKIQYEDRLQFNLDIQRETLNVRIPPMIVQMLVEHAIKHGILQLKNGGKINIKTYFDNHLLYIIVKNTGQLTESNSSTQIGVKNIEERLKLLYNNEASFSLTEDKDEVTAKIIIEKKLVLI